MKASTKTYLVGLFILVLGSANAAEPQTYAECLGHHQNIDPENPIEEKIRILQEKKSCLVRYKYEADAALRPMQGQTFQLRQEDGTTIELIPNSVVETRQSFQFKQAEKELEETNDELQTARGQQQFLGQNFGYGFGISFYDGTIIDDAVVENGIVRAQSKKREEARVLLEFHALLIEGKSKNFGQGPFAALVASEDEILSGVGFGWLWSFRNTSKKDQSAFSIGLGYMIDNDVKSLASGFKDGKPLPPGETDVRFVSEPRESYLLFLTNNF